MKTRLRSILFPALSLFLIAFAPNVLHAQATKIFVASYGNDANDGSRGAPKRNFQAAHDAVAAKGQIVVLDTAGYGKLFINKSVSITVPPGVNGFITVGGDADGITINASATDRVALRGLIIEGSGSSSGFGIRADSLSALTVEDCTIRSLEAGVYFSPPNSGTCIVRGTVVRDVRLGFAYFNITSGVYVGTVTDCTVDNASFSAVFVENDVTGGSCLVTASHCVLTNSPSAIDTKGDGGAQVVLENSLVTNCDYCFYKENANNVAYSRGNNTGAYVNHLINGTSVTSLPAF